MGTFVFGDGKDINRDIDVFGESNDTKDPNDKGSIDFGTALMNEIFNSDDAIDLNKIPETDMVADGVNMNTSSDNQPKFINKPMPNPEYFKMGEAVISICSPMSMKIPKRLGKISLKNMMTESSN